MNLHTRAEKLALDRARRLCLARQQALAPGLLLELTLEAWGWSLTRTHDPRTPTRRALDRVGRELYEAPVLLPFGISSAPRLTVARFSGRVPLERFAQAQRRRA